MAARKHLKKERIRGSRLSNLFFCGLLLAFFFLDFFYHLFNIGTRRLPFTFDQLAILEEELRNKYLELETTKSRPQLAHSITAQSGSRESTSRYRITPPEVQEERRGILRPGENPLYCIGLLDEHGDAHRPARPEAEYRGLIHLKGLAHKRST